MTTVTRLNHTVKTTKGFTLRTPMAVGQVWHEGGRRYRVQTVFRKKVRFLCQSGTVTMTCDQALFVKSARLKAD